MGGGYAHPPTNKANSINDFNGLTNRSESHYPAAIAFVAFIGNFNTLHSALKFASRGRVLPASQKYTHGPLTPTISATSSTDRRRLIRASRR